MSVVIAAANMKRLVFKADGYKKVYDSDKVVDNFERVIFFNKDCIVGFAGFDEMAKMLIGEYIRMANESNIDIATLEPSTVVYDLCEFAKVANTENHELSIAVGGKEDGRIVLYGFTSIYKYGISDFSPEDDNNIKYIALGLDYTSDTPAFNKFYRGNEALESCMNRYIRFLAETKETVNDIIQTKKITLE